MRRQPSLTGSWLLPAFALAGALAVAGCRPSPSEATAPAATPPLAGRSPAGSRAQAATLAVLRAHAPQGARLELRASAYVSAAPPDTGPARLYFSYVETAPDGSVRRGEGVAQVEDDGRRVGRLWRREAGPTLLLADR